MRADQILQLWESSQRDSLTAAAAAMLHAGLGDMSYETCHDLPIGARDQALLRLRERLFGPELVCRATCPACADPHEFTTTTAALRVDPAPSPRFTLARGDLRLELRLPGGADVLAAVDDPDPQGALVRRCLVAATRGDAACPEDQLGPDTWDAIAAAIAAHDPAADLRFALRCLTCGADWLAPFDIVAVLRDELTVHAGRILADTLALARASGWREADILALSPVRRQAYLDLLRA